MKTSSLAVIALIVAEIMGCGSASQSIFQRPSVALVNTQWVVVNRRSTILTVIHSKADDEWMFFADVNPIVDVQVSVPLEELLKLDSTIRELSDLPPGWKATRERKGAPWNRQELKQGTAF